jgi:hypothetical protein
MSRNLEEELDYVLKYFETDKDYEDARHFRQSIKQEISNKELDLLLEKLCLDGYLSGKEIDAPNSSPLSPPTFYRITYHGRLFIKRGAYKSESRSIARKKAWEIIKIIAIALNAIALIIIGFLTLTK